jgi:hypothetical protein
MHRRSFLTGVAASALSAAPKKSFPTIQLGDKSVTRLIAGANPIGGFSHSTQKLSDLMVQYFTTERTTEYILHCEEEGINTWQIGYSKKVRDALLAARERGSKIQWICLSNPPKDEGVWKEILDLKPIAICHHGEVTDRLFRSNGHEQVHEFVKKVHDAGLLAGISTHSPENIARVEDSGWGNDLYMGCFYNIRRNPEEIKAKLGDLPVDELYLQSDPAKMTARLRQVKKPCLGFKILAAGRLCKDKATVDRAFAFAFANIKPSDAVIVGLFPVLSDEIREDADLARKYGSRS